MSNWYTHCYRRNLVDMHIADPVCDLDWQGHTGLEKEFFSRFSPEDYVEDLKLAHIQAPMIYLQSHVGHCYFPTRVGHMHSAFVGREDMMRRTVDLCRAESMYVVGYYSLIYNSYEEERHPEWRVVTGQDGSSQHQRGVRYGHCCPNNPEYRQFLKAQIKEIADYFTLDGMFFDMTFWPGICRCPHCMAGYRAIGINEVPAVDWADPTFRRLVHHLEQTMGEFAAYITGLARQYMPGVSVEHNFANAVASDDSINASTELVNLQCDYTGGDLYGDLYNHSFTAKYYYGVSQNQPFEYMTCRCDNSLLAHTNTKTEEQLTTEVLLTAAHHGASFIIDAIDPRGTMDRRVYRRIGRVFEKQMPYEAYFSGRLMADVGVYYACTGRYNTHGLPFTSKTGAIGAVRAMVEAHIPVGVLSNAATGSAGQYRMVLAPCIAGISDQNRADLLRYVQEGGVLYLSGAEDPELLRLLLGAEVKGMTEHTAVYMAPTDLGQPLFGEFNRDFPLPTEQVLPLLDMDMTGVRVLAAMTLPYTKLNERRFASIHSNPPGLATDTPALLAKQVGKGTVIWSAAPLETDGRHSHKKLLTALVRRYLGQATVLSDAPRQVELVSFARENDLLVSAVDLLCTDELLPIRPFTVQLCTDKKPAGVYLLGGEEEVPLPFTWQDGYTRFALQDMVMFRMVRVEL